jgi:two-component sensor histidine kinase
VSPLEVLPSAPHAALRKDAGVAAQHTRPLCEVAIGTAAALLAVGLRYLLPLSPVQLPTLTVVVAVAITATFRGLAAGLAAALVGGLLSWCLFFELPSPGVSAEGFIPLFGFSVIAGVILTTSHLYRLSERRNRQAEVEAIRRQAEASELFARELAHRLKNTLAIVQSIAFQTLGDDRPETARFAARLKTLADAHDLLSQNVERPTASVADVVAAALGPFASEGERRIDVETTGTRIASQEVLMLSLALHELATNAVRHGALSRPEGRVRLTVEEAGRQIRLVWTETGGPPVMPPQRKGFGTTLLGRVGSDAELAFEPEGLRCTLSLRRQD